MESPTVDNLKAQLPPVAPPDVALAAVTVGAIVKAELPAFEDPGGKGLALHAAPSPPPGLTLHDLGNGRSTLQGTATTAGHYEFEVVAINHNDRSARMKVTLEVGEASKPGSSARRRLPRRRPSIWSRRRSERPTTRRCRRSAPRTS